MFWCDEMVAITQCCVMPSVQCNLTLDTNMPGTEILICLVPNEQANNFDIPCIDTTMFCSDIGLCLVLTISVVTRAHVV